MNIFDLTAKIKLDTDEYTKGLKGASEQSNSFISKLGGGIASGMKVAGTILASASAGVVAFGKSSVEAGADFDKSMSQVSATMGMTNEEMQNTTVSVDGFTGSLRDFAQKMGSETAFSATQCADALNYMALAGYDVETSVKMLPNVLNLASAGNIDLASASDMVTDAQTALGLSIDETNEMVDKMAKASSKSNTSVAQLGDAFLTVGGTAKNLKGGTTELSQVLGVLADNGIKGSEAGTHLRNIMLALNPTTKDAIEAFDALGINAYDANGELRPMQDVFLDLNDAMADFTDQQKTDALSKMFNKTDLSAVNALLSTQADRWTDLGAEIDNATGSAQAMANTQLDNLAGDITLFKSALEGAKIAISDGITPVLREFVKFASEGLSEVTRAFKEEGVAGAVEALGDIISKGLTMLTEALPKVVEAGMGIITSLIKGIMENLPMIIDSAVQIVDIFVQGIIENIPMIFEGALQIILGLVDGISSALPNLIPAVVDVILKIVDTLVSNLDKIVDSGIKLIVALAEGLMNALPKLLEKIPEIIVKLVDAIMDNLPKIIEAGIQLTITLAKGLIDALPKLLEKIPEIITRLVDAVTENLPQIIEAGISLTISLAEGLIEALPKLLEKIPEIIVHIVEAVVQNLPKILEAGVKIIVALAEGLIKAIPQLVSAVPKLISALVQAFGSLLGSFANIGKNIVDGIWNGISNAWGALTSRISGLVNGLVGGVKGLLGIHSPSRVFAGIGEFMAEGLGVGWEDEFPEVQRDINHSLNFEAQPVKVNGVNASGSFGAGFDVDALTEAFTEAVGTLKFEWDDRNLGRMVRNYA